jgi:hypothetical protein
MNNFQFLINQNIKEKEGEVFIDQEENDDNKNIYNEIDNKNNENQENNKRPKFISRVGKNKRPRRNLDFNSLEMFKKRREMKRQNFYVDEEHA